VDHGPYSAGRSHHGLPVRRRHIIALNKPARQRLRHGQQFGQQVRAQVEEMIAAIHGWL
jgi:hypothetical protein